MQGKMVIYIQYSSIYCNDSMYNHQFKTWNLILACITCITNGVCSGDVDHEVKRWTGESNRMAAHVLRIPRIVDCFLKNTGFHCIV